MTLRLDSLNQVGPACRALNAEKLGTTMPATGATRAVQGRSGGGTAAGPSEPAPTTGPPSFTLPYPPAALSPNSRSATWHKKAAAARRYRRDCGYAARSVLGPRVQAFAAPVIDLTFYCKTAHSRDADNHIAMMKPAMDALTDIGLWADDCRVRWGAVKFEKAAEPMVRVGVREALTDCRRVEGTTGGP